MKIFDCTVKEVLKRTVKIEAESEEEALRLLKEQYVDQDIVLDWDDHYSTDYEIEEN